MSTIQSILASLALGILLGFTGAWKYQSNKYERQIEHDKAQTSLAQTTATEETLKNERESAQAVSKLSAEHLQKLQELSTVQTRFRELDAKYNGLYIRVKSCQAPSQGASPSSSGSAPSESSIPEQWGELPRDVAARLEEVAREADELKVRAEVAQKYAEEIVKMRERMMKEME